MKLAQKVQPQLNNFYKKNAKLLAQARSFCYTITTMKTSPKKSSPRSLGKQLKSLFIGEKKEIKLLGIIILAGLIGIAVLALSSSKSSFIKEKIAVKDEEKNSDCEFRAKLNGVCVNNFEAQIPTLISVMIENHPDSRPQAGLAEADVVYEAMVEGNYTRFLALYPYTTKVDKVGPVRSARPYFLDWVAEYHSPVYMHVGGSPDALKLIKTRGVWDIDEFFHGNSFWRSKDRLAPHNTYTNTERWTKLMGTETEIKYSGWEFNTTTPNCVTGCVDFIEIPYLRPDFVTGWKFNSSTQNYERWQDGAPHKTEKDTIHADTIAIMEAPVKVLDGVGRLEMKTIGSGPAVVVVNGKRIMGTWQKSGPSERTNFYDANGVGIKFKPGKIWIQVVPRLSTVTFTEV